ncbi:hypothetical protein Glove_188g39 [Diversispora epigaea]|uniref:BED-type domain-containing protein n=1 Tax=Diversispora epigaea TaxID=1348612 RepID=A0A397IV78_9GLOM|nr:hypothetical protein Glove_188g39 [Diversispora epigaea]
MIDSEDELLISTSNRKRSGRPKNEVWQHFNTIPTDSTNGKKDLHSGAACKFCKQKWSCGKTSEMMAHLALQYPKPPPPKDELLISTSNRKRSGRPKNEVWQHFNTIPTDSTNGKKDLHSGAACKFCKQKWSCGKTSEMMAHLALQYPKPPPPKVRALYLEILNNRSFDDNDDDNSSKRLKPYKQSKITNHVERLTVTDDKQRRCFRALTKFFVTCGVPLWIVENPFFIDYSKELCPGFQVPKRTILSTTMINVETATVIAEMKKKLSNETNLTLDIFNFDYYLLAYFLHPKYRDTGLQINTFRIICEKALSICKLLGRREKSTNELIAQISNYSLKSKPYDFEFVTGIYTVKNWWLMYKQQNNHIQKLALLMASIVPSNASCERYFSILGWYMNKQRTSLNCSLLQNMLQMHAYYVSNISNEIKHAYKELSDEGFKDAITKTTFPFDNEIFDENDNELENNQFENDNELKNNQFENNEVLEIEVTVEISLSTEYTDSGKQDFNIESIINKSLERRESSLDGWTSPAGQFLYIFLIMTSDGKEYIHSLKNFSKNSHTGEFLKNEIIKVIEEVEIVENMIKGGGLKKYVITRWTIAYDCTDSIIRCKNALKQILENESQLLNLEIISILRKQNFFKNVKDLRTILLPIKKAIINLEHKSTTLADCFINLVIMATVIKELSQTSNQNFSKECQNVFDKRWKEFNFDYYLLAYFLHPKYRDTGLQINTFRIICEKALSICKLLGRREKSTNELIAQISNYSLKSKPYDFEFVTGIYTVKNWWLMYKQQNNHIQKLALLMASIVPSNASCERYFSILGWYMNKQRTSLNCSLLQNMLQMHAYYVSNISNEIKHAYKELSDEGFKDAITKTTFPFDNEIFDENDNELENNQFENDNELKNNQFENNEGENQISNSQNFDSFFNVTDIELR